MHFRNFLKNLLKNATRRQNPRLVAYVMMQLGYDADINTVRDILALDPIPSRYFTRLAKVERRQGKLVPMLTVWNYYHSDRDMRHIQLADYAEGISDTEDIDYDAILEASVTL